MAAFPHRQTRNRRRRGLKIDHDAWNWPRRQYPWPLGTGGGAATGKHQRETTCQHHRAGALKKVSVGTKHCGEGSAPAFGVGVNTFALFVATPVARAAMTLGAFNLQDGGGEFVHSSPPISKPNSRAYSAAASWLPKLQACTSPAVQAAVTETHCEPLQARS